jgi:CxxC motif-containing protein (DUF1111 family)
MSSLVGRSLARMGSSLVLAIATPGFGCAGTPAAHDPGIRPIVPPPGGGPGTPLCASHMTPFDPLPVDGLTAAQLKLFCSGLAEFRKVDVVKADGLGPTMNLNSCVGCHAFPASGGSSPPPPNPQIVFLRSFKPGTNVAPSFVTVDGPVREVRFINGDDGKPDGGVHPIFTITGLPDADGCNLKQPDFAAQFKGINKPGNNAIFRIPTPVFGAGLVEQIEDRALVANQQAGKTRAYSGMGQLPAGHLNFVRAGHTTGSENRNGNDGTIARFGWKAQNKSLLVFSGEAYNVEMGISNELFQTERNEQKECQFHTVPNDTTSPENLAAANPDDRYDAYSDIVRFAAFMRFLAPPVASTDTPGGAPSIARGRQRFEDTGCAHCHTPELRTSANSSITALNNKPVKLYSDLALHDMGDNLADGITQGQAGPREFRSAPLWGLGQRTHFIHDGRTADLVRAIEEHYSPGRVGRGGSEANPVVKRFQRLSTQEQQDLLNFLRSL